MAFTSEKLQFRCMGFGLNSGREVLRMQHSGNFMLHDDAFTPHLVRIEFGSNRRSVARGIKLCKSTCKRSEIQSRRYPSRASQTRKLSFAVALHRRTVRSLGFRTPASCPIHICRQEILSSGKLGITLNEENTAVEMFRKCHGSQQTA